MNEDIVKLIQAIRLLATEADMYQNDEGDGMELADAITEAENIANEVEKSNV